MVGPVMQAVDSVWLCLAISTKASACSIQVGPPEWPDLEKSTGSFCFLFPPLRISRVLGTIMAASGPPCPPELLVSCLHLGAFPDVPAANLLCDQYSPGPG